MKIAPVTPDEQERLADLYEYNILDTEADHELDNIVQLASQICQTPVSLVSLIDEHRQWFKAKYGLNVAETPRDIAFCAHAIHQKQPFIVPNALEDERFAKNPLVTGDPSIRFYAGIPLESYRGHNIGTLCVIDRQVRSLSPEQVFALQTLANAVKNILNLRLKLKENEVQTQRIVFQSKELAEKDSINKKILSVLTHDLRAPIQSLRSLFTLMQNNILEHKDFQLIVDDIANRLEATEGVMYDVFEWATIHIHSTEIVDNEDIPLKEMVKEIAQNFSSKIVEKKISLQYDTTKIPTIFADARTIRFILRNLIANALKFTPVGGMVRLITEYKDDTIEIAVEDSGIGINQEDIAKLFNWQTRHNTVGTAGEKGTGVGLLLCRDFARRLGGDIRLERLPQGGTKAILAVPNIK